MLNPKLLEKSTIAPVDKTIVLPSVQDFIVDTESVIVERYRRRLWHLNKNWLGVITGATGSGKSYTALRLAEEIDPTFNVDRVVFSPTDFLQLFERQEVSKGQIVVWEEAGVTLGARDFATRVNKAINYFLQSFRSKNTGVIFTLPSLSMLDSQARALAHTLMQPIGISKNEGICNIKLWELQVNPVLGKTYRHNIKILIDGTVFKVTQVGVKIPSVKLRHEYEKKKDAFVYALASASIKKMQPPEERNSAENAGQHSDATLKKLDKLAEEVYKAPQNFYGQRNNVTAAAISENFNLTHEYGRKVFMRYMRKKREREALEAGAQPVLTRDNEAGDI